MGKKKKRSLRSDFVVVTVEYWRPFVAQNSDPGANPFTPLLPCGFNELSIDEKVFA